MYATACLCPHFFSPNRNKTLSFAPCKLSSSTSSLVTQTTAFCRFQLFFALLTYFHSGIVMVPFPCLVWEMSPEHLETFTYLGDFYVLVLLHR